MNFRPSHVFSAATSVKAPHSRGSPALLTFLQLERLACRPGKVAGLLS